MSDCEMVKVRLSDDYYLHEQFDTLAQTWWSKDDLYDVPAEQLERWEASRDAWLDVQTEIRQLIDARAAEKRAVAEAQRQREEQRRAEIRADLYGGRKKQ